MKRHTPGGRLGRQAGHVLSASLVTIALVSCSTESTLPRENLGRTRFAATPVFRGTEKVCQLTGEVDRGVPGIAGSDTGMVRGGGAYGITGTDIGWAVEHDGYLHFMFGDTRNFSPDKCEPAACGVYDAPTALAIEPPLSGGIANYWPSYTNPNPDYLYDPDYYKDYLDTRGNSPESWARVPLARDPSLCLDLEVATMATANGTSFRQTKLNGRILPRQEGALSGFSDGQSIFGFFTQKAWPANCEEPTGCAHDSARTSTDPLVPGGKTAIAVSSDGGANFDQIAHFSTTRFQFVAPSVVAQSWIPNPHDDELTGDRFVVAFGAGRVLENGGLTWWNHSLPYLAMSDLARVTERAPSVAGVAAFSHVLIYQAQYVSPPIAHTGPAIGLAREDRLVLGFDDRVLVVRTDGHVWSQAVEPTTVGPYTEIPPRQLPDALVGTNPHDRHIIADPKRSRLIVITDTGEVWAHPVTDHIEAPYLLAATAPIAARVEDNWVLVVDDRLVVVTKRGRVYGHRFSPDGFSLDVAALLSPGPIAGAEPSGSPAARWVTSIKDHLVIISGRGETRLHRVDPDWDYIYPEESFGPFAQVGWSDHDRWLVPVTLSNGEDRLVAISYRPTSWRYFKGLVGGVPTWTSDENLAKPLWSGQHECLGYYSARYFESQEKWVMLYTCGAPDRGVFMRTAMAPWGPWSNPQKVLGTDESGEEYFPSMGNPYCRFMHLPGHLGDCDENPFTRPNPYDEEKRSAIPPQVNGRDVIRREQGGEYAPFLLPGRYATTNGSEETTLYYTLSTWNPYQTVLMQLKVGL